MSILILNRVPYDLCPYDEWLQNTGEELILLTSDEYVDGFDPEKYAYIESFSNYNDNGCVELRAVELYEKYKYRAVLGVSERDVLRASWLRERFNLPGQHWSSALGYRNKIIMKQIAQRAQLTVPEFAPVNSSFDLIQFIEEHDYPVIVKPIDSAGAVGTYVLHDQQDLEKLLAEGVPHNVEVEKFIEGEFYHVDGLVYQGEIVMVSVSHYVMSCLSFHDDGFTGSYLIDQESELALRMKEEVRKIVDEMDTPEHTTFHAEFFHTPNDEVVFCEIASRTAGARISISLEEAYGFNINKAWIEAQLGLPVDLPEEIKLQQYTGSLLVPPKKKTFVSASKDHIPDWVLEYRIVAKQGEQFDDPSSSIDSIGSLVIAGDGPQQLFDRIFEGKQWFDKSVTWE